jgi:hypothetical protein
LKKIFKYLFFGLLVFNFSFQANGQNITSAEYFFGSSDPGAGSATPLSVLDGNFDKAIESVFASYTNNSTAASTTTFNIRLKDVNNVWGPIFKKTIFLRDGTYSSRDINITQFEYFFGNFDPGEGSGTSILVFDGNFDEAIEEALASYTNSASSNSTMLFNIRAKDINNVWGPRFKKTIFLRDGTYSSRDINITQFEYFFGNFDPGEGSGTTLLAFDGNLNEAVEEALASYTNSSSTVSTMLFNIRAKDINNVWGPRFKKTIFFRDGTYSSRDINITQFEYFFGNFDPGEGSGTSILAFDGNLNEAIEEALASYSNTATTQSQILFNIRAKDINNVWGPRFKKTIFLRDGTYTSRDMNITQFEYFFGNFDPGEGSGTQIVVYDGNLDEAIEEVYRNQVTWSMTSGPVLFNIRAKDINNVWGPRFKKTVFPYGANSSPNLVQEGDTIKECKDIAITINYDGPFGYSPTWFDNSTGQSITFTPTNEGYYTVSANLGSTTYYDSVYVKYKPMPTSNVDPAGDVLVCGSSNFYLTGSTDVSSTATYQWYLNNSPISNSSSNSHLPTAIGEYYLSNQY